MITKNEIINILHNHADIVYEADGEYRSTMIRSIEFDRIADEIIKKSKNNSKANIKLIRRKEDDDLIGIDWNNGEFYK